VSARGVVYRREAQDGQIEVALVGRLRPKRWALPKGTPEVGETLEGTALREVGEETGLLVRIERPLDRIQYRFVWGGVRHFKTVHFYLMEMVGGDTANHDGEYDVVEWFPIGEALRRLSYRGREFTVAIGAKRTTVTLDSGSAVTVEGPKGSSTLAPGGTVTLPTRRLHTAGCS